MTFSETQFRRDSRKNYSAKRNSFCSSGLTPAPADSGSAAGGTLTVFQKRAIITKGFDYPPLPAEPNRWAALET